MRQTHRETAGMACVVCDAAQPSFLYRWTGGLGVYRCPVCGLLSTSIGPGQLITAQAGTSPPSHAGQTSGHMRKWEEAEQYLPVILAALRRYFDIVGGLIGGEPVRSFLDVGGGTGLYAKAAQLLGYQSYFVDIDEQAVHFAKHQLGVEHVIQADIQTLGQNFNRTFDVVLARHTIEHLPAPGVFMHNLARLVTPGKVLVLETPNAAGWEQWAHPRIFGFYWNILGQENPELSASRRLRHTLSKALSVATPPKHVYGFNRTNLSQLLRRSEFQVRKCVITTCGDPTFDPLYYRIASFQRRPAQGRVYYVYERLVSSLIRALGRGSQLVLFSQRAAAETGSVAATSAPGCPSPGCQE